MNQKVEDPIVMSVMTKFYERSQAGIKKYNTMLTREDLSTLEWLNHAQDEAMDFCLYLERLKQEFKTEHQPIDMQVAILKDTLEEMMTGFESEEDRMNFILDICNGYKKRIQ